MANHQATRSNAATTLLATKRNLIRGHDDGNQSSSWWKNKARDEKKEIAGESDSEKEEGGRERCAHLWANGAQVVCADSIVWEKAGDAYLQGLMRMFSG